MRESFGAVAAASPPINPARRNFRRFSAVPSRGFRLDIDFNLSSRGKRFEERRCGGKHLATRGENQHENF
jgi:hypothetical protein